jgi:hypothetical protein
MKMKEEVLAALGADSSHEDTVTLLKRHNSRTDDFALDEVSQTLSRCGSL